METTRPVKRAVAFRNMALIAILVLFAACSHIKPDKPTATTPADFTLTVLHTNDVHSAYGGLTNKGLICYAATCEGGRGGYVRLDQAVRAIRKDNPDALFLDAGDIFQGTLFWVKHKERMPMALIDKMGYQAIVPGNHEFDEGWPTWLRYVDALKTPVAAANVFFDPRPDSPAIDKLHPFIVLEQGGRKIGIVGLITEQTPEASAPGPGVSFKDARKTLEETVAKLKEQNVNIIIVVAHIGLTKDRLLAQAVDGVDIIVGAHSHSLLSNALGKAEGPYPVVEKSPAGAPVLIVTASTACTFLGKLDVVFDEKGIIRKWKGEPILLDQPTLASLNAPPPDAELVRLIDEFAAPVTQMMVSTIGAIIAAGRDGLPLEDPTVMECRKAECLSGNIIADALRVVPFREAQITLLNAGGLRASLPGGAITPGHVIGSLPFQNYVVTTKMPGAVVLQALEHGIAKFGDDEGSFLQVSGLRYAFKPSNKPGERITKVEVMDNNGAWLPLDINAAYQVVTLDFLSRGGDGFVMFKSLQWEESDKLASDALRIFLERYSPVEVRLEGRIIIQR